MSDDREQSLIEFPCAFPIKMMGRDQDSFRKTAVELVESHVGKVAEDAIKTAASSKGNFVSVTITINAESQQQLDDIYRTLSAHEEILVAL